MTGDLIAIVFISFVGMFAIVALWQVFATARARISVEREAAYKKLAEDATHTQRMIAEGLERNTAELSLLRQHTAELERILKSVE